MTAKLSILQNYKPSLLRREPFPYLIIEKALPDDLYQKLAAAYPTPDTIFKNNTKKKHREMQSNTRYDISAEAVYRNPNLDMGLWRDFVLYHTSQDYLDEFMEKFGEVIETTYPHLMQALKEKGSGSRPRAGVRHRSDQSQACDFALDCQVGMNSPVTGAVSSVRSLHLDKPEELIAGLFYCRDAADTTPGGDLMLYKLKPGLERSFYKSYYIREERTEVIASVPYAPNTFAALFNTLDSIHAVSPRHVSPFHRRLVNIIVEVYPTMPRLFDERPYAESNGILGWLKSKLG